MMQIRLAVLGMRDVNRDLHMDKVTFPPVQSSVTCCLATDVPALDTGQCAEVSGRPSEEHSASFGIKQKPALLCPASGAAVLTRKGIQVCC